MRHSVVVCTVTVFLFFFTFSAQGQDNHRFNFSAGGGFTIPNATASANLNTGWNLDFRGGVSVNPSLLADLDFTYNRWNLTRAALAHVGEPGGYADVWSLTFAPVIRLSPHHRLDPYIIGGAGLYHRGLTLTQPALFTTFVCDPFFGFCYPATAQGNQVVASFSTYKFGFNAGGGLEFGVGTHNLKVFAESRYHEMFTTRGSNLIYWPVTFGLRW